MKNLVYQLFAAVTFFTRIPIWRLMEVPVESYRKIITFWSLTGWITGGITALGWIAFSTLFPPVIALILAFAIRTLITGGLHEDGLGDFFDGFGGGRKKEDVLRIMKDSHIGSYALIGLILYYLLLINSLLSIKPETVGLIIFVADPLSKFMTSILMNVLPYSRKESESKSKTIYDKLSVGRIILAGIFGIAPMLYFLNINLWISILAPIAIMIFMIFLSNKKIGGYTGDICGATTLLCELSFMVAILALTYNV